MAPGAEQQSPKALDRVAVIEALGRTLLHQQPASPAQDRTAPAVLLKSGADLVMALVHVIMIKFGCRFIGLGEDGPTTTSQEPSASNDADNIVPLPFGWNSTGDTYSFRYRHTQSTFTFLIKCVKVSNRMVIHAMALEDGKLLTLELNLHEYIGPSFPFPYRSGSNRQIAAAFISDEIIEELVTKIRTEIVQRILPGHGVKLGYEEAATSSSTAQNRDSSASRNVPPSRPDPLRFETPPYGGRWGIPAGIGAFGIGDRDLDPFVAAPGIIPPRGMGIGNPFGGMGGGGMVVGPDHPMFGGVPGGVGGFGPLVGGPDRLGPLAVPPGARFDPIGPFGPGAGGPVRPGRGSGRGQPFSGEPDNDELPPPGYNDMFM
ncbi:hypothetical protein SeMB42_g03586 [Synchytrium endobioticum]|uniref:Uncharacterized protein n=1 Tax=Synchytrium endobioticum TaxID=286115 RepID=A0A507CP80_9FUNG|nr:hypothetical protein SeLEV6574_g06344 [Synchytrium endobioticum]TPX46700.1 hypothetical protein SeMB42_g03586 [Synchytrium endobioticum]